MGHALTETENLMWNLGRDPNLASTMGLVAVLDGRPDPERLRTTVVNTVASVERLRQHITRPPSASTSLARPEWRTDPWFDLDHHLRFVGLTGRRGRGPGSLADLRRLAAQLINDPFDLARPLWQFHLVTGLRGGRSALIGKVHHSISDGIGLLRLAGSLLEFEPDSPAPDQVDLEAILALGDQPAGTDGPASADGNGPGRLRDLLQQAARVPGPRKVLESSAELLSSAKVVTEQLPRSQASPLWATRSRNRRLELVALPMEPIRAVAEEYQVTINDLFVAACGQGAVRYHREQGVEIDQLTATVVVNTGQGDRDDPAADNAFIPVPVSLPGTAGSATDRLAAVSDEVRRRRAALDDRPDVLATLGAIGGLVPTGMAATLALDQASRVDFATSNLPGPPIPTWLAGRAVERIHPVGPVAGTAFNITFMSYDQEALLGLHVDPAAVADPAGLARCVTRGFGDFGVRSR